MTDSSVTLLIGLPASGKSTRCLQLLREHLSARPLLQARVLLPDHSQVLGFKRRLAESGGGLGVRLSTFSELHHELLQRSGRLLPQAGEAALFRVLRSIVTAAAAEGALPHYAGIAHTTGFINALADRFAELKRERILPEKFLQHADPAAPGESELAELYNRYQRHLQQCGWADREGQAWLAVEMLQQTEIPPFDFDLLILDGFNEFTPVQVALLRALAPYVPQIFITLTGAPPAGRSAHGRFDRARARLLDQLNPRVEYLSDPPRLSEALTALEAGFYEAATRTHTAANRQVHLLELRSPAEEAREALRWIKALLLRQPGLQPWQTAIFSPDIDLHLPYLKTAAAEFRLPLHSRFPEPLIDRPEIRALADLLELVPAGFPRRPVLEALRSPFFNLQSFDLLPEDAAFLEALSYEYQVVAGLEQWRQAFTAAQERRASDAGSRVAMLADQEDSLLPGLPEAADIERIQSGFEGFFGHYLQPPPARSLEDWTLWLRSRIESLHFERLAPVQVLQELHNVLDQIILSEELLFASQAGAALEYSAFLQELLAALQGQGVLQDQVPADQGIFVAPLIEARGLRFEAVAVLGLSEGIFPAVERADPFLGEALRRRLGMETRLGRFQSSLFYQAVLRTNHRLLLTRPYLAEGGEPWQPSPYWQSLTEIFPDSVSRLRPADLRSLQQAASTAEALFWQARDPSPEPQPGPERSSAARLAALRHKATVLAARLTRQAAGPYEGQPDGLQPHISRRYGPDYLWSASRFETYASCPQRFYAQVALDLQPLVPPRPGFEPSHLGSILHELLEETYRAAQPPHNTDDLIASLQRVSGSIFAAAPGKYGFRPGPLWEIEQAQLLARLEENIHALESSREDWQPAAFEARFGLDGEPPLTLDTPQGPVQLRGLIDRVDTRPGGGVRVIDYKTGGSHLAKSHLLEGLRLQLPLYAAAAQALGLGQPVDGFYWYLGGAKPGSLKLASFEAEGYPPGFEGALEVAREHLAASLQGIREADFAPLPPSPGCPSYCPAAAWCWRYKPSGW